MTHIIILVFILLLLTGIIISLLRVGSQASQASQTSPELKNLDSTVKPDRIRFDQANWQPAGVDGVEIATLWGKEEDNSAIYAFRIQPGVTIPPHTHSRDYWGVSVQGKWVHIDENGNKVITGQNEFVRVKGGDLHSDSCLGPEVCINILDFDGPRDIDFPK